MKPLENFYRASLIVACGNSTGKIYVDVLPQLDEGYLVISPSNSTKREIIAYNGKGTDEIGNYINVTQRGLGGTTAQSHSVGEPIRGNLTAEHWNEMKEEVDNSVRKTGNETIAGVKTFSSFPILPDDTPTEDNQAVHKKYVDEVAIQGAPNASSTTKGITKLSVDPEDPNNPIAVGSNDPILQKIPSSLPVPISQGGTGATTASEARANLDVPSNSEVVKLTGNQTIGGVKTFTSIPVLPNSDPTDGNQATRKAYVDANDDLLKLVVKNGRIKYPISWREFGCSSHPFFAHMVDDFNWYIQDNVFNILSRRPKFTFWGATFFTSTLNVIYFTIGRSDGNYSYIGIKFEYYNSSQTKVSAVWKITSSEYTYQLAIVNNDVFNKYTVEHTGSSIKFYMNDVLLYTATENIPTNSVYFLQLRSSGYGGNFKGKAPILFECDL